MKSQSEQKEITKMLNEISRAYRKIDKLEAENKILKKKIKELNK